MDFDEWEFLFDDGYLDFNEEVSERQINFKGKGNMVESSKTSTVLDMDYFCSSPKTRQRVFNQLVPLLIHLNPKISNPQEGENNGLVVKDTAEPDQPDQDTVSQARFQIKVCSAAPSVKLDSPKSSCRGILPNSSGLKFEEKGEALEVLTSLGMKIIESDKEEEFNKMK